MKNSGILTLLLGILLIYSGCSEKNQPNTFGDDVDFLKEYTKVVLLRDSLNQSMVAVCPQLQGRVMTSSSDGLNGQSYGWINYDLISSGENNPHFNAFGGEERIWFGPEGGQFSLFFSKGDPFDLDHWYTPPAVNEEPFSISGQGDQFVEFSKHITLMNYGGFVFDLNLNRKVSLLGAVEVNKLLESNIPESLDMVAYETTNEIVNTGKEPWVKETGLISIWILSMFNPSKETTIVIPFTEGDTDSLGAIVKDDYFGKVPSDRLIVRDKHIFFKGDGLYRSKIGLSFHRAKNVLGSYDAGNRLLTIVHYNKPDSLQEYVNSSWEIQEEPYKGDVINSYNDGPTTPGGKPLGPFYELETSSPAAQLNPGESLVHQHRVMHFKGSGDALNELAISVLKININDIKNACNHEN